MARNPSVYWNFVTGLPSKSRTVPTCVPQRYTFAVLCIKTSLHAKPNRLACRLPKHAQIRFEWNALASEFSRLAFQVLPPVSVSMCCQAITRTICSEHEGIAKRTKTNQSVSLQHHFQDAIMHTAKDLPSQPTPLASSSPICEDLLFAAQLLLAERHPITRLSYPLRLIIVSLKQIQAISDTKLLHIKPYSDRNCKRKCRGKLQ